VLFKHSSKAERVAGVKLNQLLNVKLKYEFLEDTAVLADVEFNGKKITVAQVLIKAKMNGVFLFNGVEQGVGKYSSRVYVYYKPGMRNILIITLLDMEE